MRRLPIAAACVLAVAAVAAGAWRAYPNPPQPLRELVHHSDLVVLARVEHVRGPRAADPEQPHFDDACGQACLVVVDTWKGDAQPGEHLDVAFFSVFFCEPPAHYPVGAEVLTFLERTRRSRFADWETLFLGQGVRTLEPGAREAWAARVREIAALQAEHGVKGPRGREVRRATVAEWVVRLAEDPATRHEARAELTRAKNGFDETYTTDTVRPEHFDAAQLARLLRVAADERGDAGRPTWLDRVLARAPAERLRAAGELAGLPELAAELLSAGEGR